jgi:hypothetical protein
LFLHFWHDFFWIEMAGFLPNDVPASHWHWMLHTQLVLLLTTSFDLKNSNNGYYCFDQYACPSHQVRWLS